MSDEAKRERDRVGKRRWREAHPEEARAKATAWRAANKDKIKEYNSRAWERAKRTPALMEKNRARGRVQNMTPE